MWTEKRTKTIIKIRNNTTIIKSTTTTKPKPEREREVASEGALKWCQVYGVSENYIWTEYRNWERISSFVYCVYSILIFIIVSFFVPFAGLRECFTFLSKFRFGQLYHWTLNTSETRKNISEMEMTSSTTSYVVRHKI